MFKKIKNINYRTREELYERLLELGEDEEQLNIIFEFYEIWGLFDGIEEHPVIVSLVDYDYEIIFNFGQVGSYFGSFAFIWFDYHSRIFSANDGYWELVFQSQINVENNFCKNKNRYYFFLKEGKWEVSSSFQLLY